MKIVWTKIWLKKIYIYEKCSKQKIWQMFETKCGGKYERFLKTKSANKIKKSPVFFEIFEEKNESKIWKKKKIIKQNINKIKTNMNKYVYI